MKNVPKPELSFRIVFIFLVAASLVMWCWQCAGLPPGPSRVGWPEQSGTKP